MLADTLDRATGTLLEEDRSPSRKVGELDNRGSHFYLALYWAAGARAPDRRRRAAQRFAPLAERAGRRRGRRSSTSSNGVQGSPVDIGGYYRPDHEKVAAAMRPSATLNEALESFSG